MRTTLALLMPIVAASASAAEPFKACIVGEAVKDEQFLFVVTSGLDSTGDRPCELR